jgi:hypothetical protein
MELLKVLTGYAAIAIGYFNLRASYPRSTFLGVAALLMTLLLFGINLYLSLRIQERLRFTRAMENAYLAKLHDECAVDPLPLPPKRPAHAHWYAFGAQTALGSITLVGLVVYFVATTPWC